MPAKTTMTIRVSSEVKVKVKVKAKLERLAVGTRSSTSFLASEAVSDFVDRELEIIDGIERGLADVRAGRVVPHAQVMAQAREIIAVAKEAKK